MSAISSLFLLGRLDILENWSIDLVVSKSTMTQLRQMIANESQVHSRKSGVFVKTESGHALVERTAEQKEAYIRDLRHLIDLLEDNCKVESCRALAAMEPEKRKMLVEVFGQYGTDAILLAAVPGAVLWTDDLVQAVLSRHEHGVSRVWTQFVIGACAESGVVNLEAFLDASAKLIGYGYYFSSQNPQIIRQAGVIAEWKADTRPSTMAETEQGGPPTLLTRQSAKKNPDRTARIFRA